MTLFSDKYKCVVLCIPKTATRSINNVLHGKYGFTRNKIVIDGKEITTSEHASALEIKENMGDSWYDFTKIATIRDPLDRLVSHYNYIQYFKSKRKNSKKTIKGQIKKTLTKMLPFYLWAIIYNFKGNRYYLLDDDENLMVDTLIDFNNIDEDFYQAFKKVGLYVENGDFKQKNTIQKKSKITPNTSYLFKKSIHQETEFYKKIIDERRRKLNTDI